MHAAKHNATANNPRYSFALSTTSMYARTVSYYAQSRREKHERKLQEFVDPYNDIRYICYTYLMNVLAINHSSYYFGYANFEVSENMYTPMIWYIVSIDIIYLLSTSKTSSLKKKRSLISFYRVDNTAL